LVDGVLLLLLFPGLPHLGLPLLGLPLLGLPLLGLPLLGLLLLLLLIFIFEGVVTTVVDVDTVVDEAFVLIDESESPSIALFAASDWD